MENGPVSVDLPMQKMVVFHGHVCSLEGIPPPYPGKPHEIRRSRDDKMRPSAGLVGLQIAGAYECLSCNRYKGFLKWGIFESPWGFNPKMILDNLGLPEFRKPPYGSIL